MAIDKAVDSAQLNGAMTATANAIRAAGGTTGSIAWNQTTGFASAVSNLGGGFYPSLLITAPTGHTITATNGVDTVTLTEISAGQYWGEVTDYGAWTVSGDDDGIYPEFNVNEVAEYTGKVAYISTTLNDNNWKTISTVSQAGTGANYWSVGDAKEITLNGTIGTKAFDNVTLCVFILDFNHPENGVADNNILWGGFKTALSNGVDVALRDWTADQNYGDYKTDGTKLFNLNHWGNYNYGGWISCDLRYDILGAVETAPSGYGSARTTSSTGSNATMAAITNPVANTLMAALPSDFRSVLRLRTHYVDSKGNKSNVDANVTAVTDAISLLAEFEVFGARSYANDYEKDHQAQMAYYAAGNSKVKYAHDVTTRTVYWWECSAYCNNTSHFCTVDYYGSANGGNAYLSCALAPAFKT